MLAREKQRMKRRAEKQRRDEREDKDKQYAKDRRSGVTAHFTDLLPPSPFM